MKVLRSKKNFSKTVIDLREEGFFVIPSRQSGLDKRQSKEITINNKTYSKIGSYYSKCYRCDEEGNPIEFGSDGSIIHYTLWPYDYAETLDEEGMPSDFIIVGYDVEKE